VEHDEDRLDLTENESSLLTEWLGKPVKFAFDIWWAQLGGEPFLIQGTETDSCPNPRCSANKAKHPMKVLAAIPNDPPGLPMLETMSEVEANNGHFNHYVQLVYYFCDQCHTVRTLNECD
jgi:hypothetical protein